MGVLEELLERTGALEAKLDRLAALVEDLLSVRDEDHWYTLQEAAERLKLSDQSVQDRIDDGTLEAVELPGFRRTQTRIPARALRRYADGRRVRAITMVGR